MLIFVSILILCFIAEAIRKVFPNKLINFLCVTFIIVLASIMPAIRDVSVGTDTNMYVKFFAMDWTYLEWWTIAGVEPGFASCIKLLQLFGVKDYFYYLLLYSVIYNTLIISTIYRLSSGKYLSLIVFLTSSSLYFSHFNILRQSIALAFFVFSLRYLLAGKTLKTYLVLVTAVFFHFSAVILLAVPVIYKNINRRPVLIVCASIAFLILYSNASFVLSFAGDLTGTSKYTAYKKTNSFGGGYFLYTSLIFFISTYILLYTKLRTDKNYRFYCYLIFMSFMTWICMLVFGLKYDGPGRIINYFYIGMLFVIPEWLKVVEKRAVPLIFFIIFAMNFMIFYYVFVISGLHAVFPYVINHSVM
ncbi:EpsG family protein [Pantoea coffeiphila]|uniref:EpsG family protein n=1 Tax=Pantoea coffeiphila TaxID=1465635 RepID=A0A2S9IGA2_9GAMM|nr:EpsG family protein [Pantoea coffeiphila]PRD16788.1 hypothetical protein CQW29_03745 [Pantoea coffeiphila]